MNYFDESDDENDQQQQQQQGQGQQEDSFVDYADESLDTNLSFSLQSDSLPHHQPAGADSTSSFHSRARPRYSDLTTSTSLAADSSSSSQQISNRGRRERSTSLSAILGDSPFSTTGERNIEKLIRCLNNETGAPELLIFPKELVQTIVKDLAKRRQLVKYASKASNADEGFYVTVALAATENMRASHILKQFLRLRIYKIEKFSRTLLQSYDSALSLDPASRTSEESDALLRLYPPELAHARGYVRLTNGYFKEAAVDQMPEIVKKKLDDVNTHPIPDLSTPVFIKARRDCPPVVTPKGIIMEYEKDSQHMIRYSTIRQLLRNDYVELI